MSPETTIDDDSVEAPEADELRDGVVDRLRQLLGVDLVDSLVEPHRDIWVRVALSAWLRVGEVLRDELGARHFVHLSAVDWMPSPWGRGEDDPTEPPPERSTEIVQGVTGGETRFQVVARVQNLVDHWGINVKVDVDEAMVVPSWIGTYAGADWHERETWEMFGISFAGHPNLSHIYLPGAFEGNPLRKDFPLVARMVKPWPGIVDVEPMPAVAEAEEESAEPDGAGDSAPAGESADEGGDQ